MSKRLALRAISPALAGKPLSSSLEILARTHLTDQRRSCGGPKSNGGAYRDRTDDLMLAKQPLSQLS